MREHTRWMRKALALAARYQGETAPNPCVGAVVVQGGRCVGMGAHRRAGEEHAEVLALRTAGESARGATVYVTLEPCNHYGKTPPCTEALIKAGVRKVVVGSRDPNPAVKGGGVERLRAAGIEVEVGVLARETDLLIADFRTWVLEQRPFFMYKAAATWDGATALKGKGRERLTGRESERFVHRLRARVDAVVVGKGTYLLDDPDLRPRLVRSRRIPYRVVLSSRVPEPRGKLYEILPEKTWIIAGEDPLELKPRWEERGARVSLTGVTPVPPRLVSQLFWEARVYRVLLEGGGTLARSFLEAGLIDWLILGFAPKVAGGRGYRGIFEGRVGEGGKGWRFLPWRLSRRGEDLWVEGPLLTSYAGKEPSTFSG